MGEAFSTAKVASEWQIYSENLRAKDSSSQIPSVDPPMARNVLWIAIWEMVNCGVGWPTLNGCRLWALEYETILRSIERLQPDAEKLKIPN